MALAAAEENPFDVILMDLQMPLMDGRAATRHLRGAGYQGTIIALTADAMAGTRQECLEAGYDDYLSKPVSRGALLQMLVRYSDGREPEQAAGDHILLSDMAAAAIERR